MEKRTLAESCQCPAKPGEPCPLSESECLRRVEASLTDEERAEVAKRMAEMSAPSVAAPPPSYCSPCVDGECGVHPRLTDAEAEAMEARGLQKKTATVPPPLYYRQIGMGEFRCLKRDALHDLKHALIVEPRGEQPVATVVPYDWYLKVVEMLKVVHDL